MSFDEGMQAFKAGDYNRAAEHFVAVTEKDENNHKAWNALGICLSKTGEYEVAGTCFENALTLDSSNDTYRRNKEKNDKKRQVIQEPSLELDDEPVVRAQPSKKAMSGYQRNYLQIPLYFVPMILSAVNLPIGFLSIILGAWYIKHDAESLNAGSNPNGSAWGKLKGWEWMLLLIFFWIVLPVYSWKREQIYEENLGFGTNPFSNTPVSGAEDLMWKYVKYAGGALCLIIFVALIASSMNPSYQSSFKDGYDQGLNENPASSARAVSPSATTIQTSISTTKPTIEQTPDTITIGQKNAAKKALSYLKYSAFSRDGLIKQLEFEKFSPAEAEYGVDQSGADWNEQAAKKAKSYLDHSSFSRDGLIKQLEFEKFTPQQAEYGVKSVGY